MSLKKIVEEGASFLQKNKIEEPRKNAEVLLSFVLNKPLYYIYTEDVFVPPKIISHYNKLLKKRASGIPLQYLIKKVNFYGYDFSVQKGVFIPRPETELLVEKTVERYNRYFSPSRIKILDIGTGCGNIAITLAKEIKKSVVVATDISEKAIKTADYNAKIHGVENRIKLLKVNLFPLEKGRFHIIVSNPPYIPHPEISLLDREVKMEPHRALCGGKDGLSIIRKILKEGDKFLYRGGFLLMEIGYNQVDSIKEIVCNLKLTGIEKDLAGIERVVIFQNLQD